jgi:zinc/manganese transport system substrate-binding protein
MTKKIINLLSCAAVVFAAGAVFSPSRADAKLRVVASIETLADLAREVGGGRIDVESLARGYQDPHFVQAKPSLVLTLNRADALLYVGLDLEVGWLPPLVQQSRNSKIQTGQAGNIDCASAIAVRDIPNIPADQLRAMGDVHPMGNPHYWIPPDNALAIVRMLAKRFTALDPAGGPEFEKRAGDFTARLRNRIVEWAKRAAPLRGEKLVTYHKSWSYVATWLGLVEVGYIEPKPGIPPTANHTAQLIQLMKQQGVKLIVLESFYPSSLANIIGREAGARVLSLPSDVGASPTIRAYSDLVDAIVSALTAAK